MTLRAAAPLGPRHPRPAATSGPATAVEVLVCGSEDRGDDAAPIKAVRAVGAQLGADVKIDFVGQLDIDDLLAVPAGAGVVIVDAAVGIEPGEIVDLELSSLVGRQDGPQTRSSHALAFPEVVRLAEFLRGPLRGRIVAIGVVRFGLGKPLSRSVKAAMPAFGAAINAAVDRLRTRA